MKVPAGVTKYNSRRFASAGGCMYIVAFTDIDFRVKVLITIIAGLYIIAQTIEDITKTQYAKDEGPYQSHENIKVNL